MSRAPSLRTLSSKQSLNILGINSGTSADGLDFSLVRLHFSGPSTFPRATFLGGMSRPFQESFRRRILAIADHADPPLSAILELDSELGEVIGREGTKVIAALKRKGYSIDAICSHGQTVRHLPNRLKMGGKKASATCQLGSLERIAAMTGLVVVGDVRQGDIATGGEGAPITVAAMKLLFGNTRESRLIVNIGGISNFFWFPAGTSWNNIDAADCGPGNLVIDQLTRQLFARPFDRSGALARKGEISAELLSWSMNQVLSHSRKSHRSTGREAFGPAWVKEFVARGRALKLRPFDLIATATELTARAIASVVIRYDSLHDSNFRLSLTGGGGKNSFLVSRIAVLCRQDIHQKPASRGKSAKIVIESIDQLGIPAQLVESSAYAVMGGAALVGYPLPTRWHSNGRLSAMGYPGRIVQPSRIVRRSEE